MYAKKFTVKKMIELLSKEPDYRDQRQKAVLKVIQDNYSKIWGKSIQYDIKIAFDVDRAFRLVQQVIPQLRGANWLLRQRMAGEITEKEYQNLIKSQVKVWDIYEQMKLDL